MNRRLGCSVMQNTRTAADAVARHTLESGLAVDGVVSKRSAGYLVLASLVGDVFARRRRVQEETPDSSSESQWGCTGNILDRMIGCPEIPATDSGLPAPHASGNTAVGGPFATSIPDSRPYTALAMESPSMSDAAVPFEMRTSEPQPVPMETLDSPMHDELPPPVREGLPKTFRMRADAHYVESLDMAPAPKLQLMDQNDPFVFSVTQSSASIPVSWTRRTSEEPAAARRSVVGAVAVAAARRVVEECNGEVTVNSIEYGSEIQIVLPRVS
jgi:hypothetical protein